VLTSIASAANESLLLLAGAAVAHDLVRKSWHERAGIIRSEAYYLLVSRVTLVIVGLVSFVAAINTPALILAIVSYSVAMIGATFFFPLLFGLSSPRTTPAAATASSVGGFLVTVIWMALTLAKVPWAAAIHPVVPGLATALVLIVAVTPFSRPAPPEALARFFARHTPPPFSPLQPLTDMRVDAAATAHRISRDPGRL
jgi:Na+/proline symporter